MIISFNFRAHPRREADRGAGAALAPGADESDRAGRGGRPDQLLLHQIQRRRQRDLAAGALPQGRRLHQVVTLHQTSALIAMLAIVECPSLAWHRSALVISMRGAPSGWPLNVEMAQIDFSIVAAHRYHHHRHLQSRSRPLLLWKPCYLSLPIWRYQRVHWSSGSQLFPDRRRSDKG